jgi:hypothetical protein
MGVRFLIAKNHKTDSHHALLCVVLTVKKNDWQHHVANPLL